MGFDSGSISFQRYAVIGQAPSFVTDAELNKLAEHAFKPTDIGVPEDVEWGWSGPRHVLDTDFSFENCVYADCIWFGLRIDTTRPPSDVTRAYLRIEEDALAKANPSGFISKSQKRAAKDTVARKLDDERREGKYRKSKVIPILWDVPAGIVYGPASVSVREKLGELFSRTFQLELQPLSSGVAALRVMESLCQRRVYEDFTPSRFALSPADSGAHAEYPWTARGDVAKDFLGNEFLLWLWYVSNSPIATCLGNLAIMFSRTLQLDCVFGHTGKDAFTELGPTKMPEARHALRQGKVPRKAGLIIDAPAGQFSVTLAGESLVVSGLRLPDIDKADSPRVLFEERITLLRDFGKVIDVMYQKFLSDRADNWRDRQTAIQQWIQLPIGKEAGHGGGADVATSH